MKIVHKKNQRMKDAITKEFRRNIALLGILFFSLILEIYILILILLKDKLVVQEPVYKIIFMCVIFIGTIWSFFSLISNIRKTVVKITAHGNEIETTSIGLFPVVSRYLETDLKIEKLPVKANGDASFVKISNSNEEELFFCSSNFFNKEELLNSHSKFLNELGKI